MLGMPNDPAQVWRLLYLLFLRVKPLPASAD
jgi:hypothetical protein